MSIKFANNATSILAAGISNIATSLTVSGGAGTLFPVLAGVDYFYCTLANVSGVVEIVKVTARAADVFTIVRGQDGTSAAAWALGDKVEVRLVAGVLNGNLVQQTGVTGSAVTPVGSTAQRDAAPLAGFLRFNTDLVQEEVYNGTSWGSVGGGATGGIGNFAFYENDQVVSVNYTITTNKNAMTAGPITIATGVTVTVPTGSTWSII